jgi:multisubunit Na+/H+ antiporter MnhB subunit
MKGMTLIVKTITRLLFGFIILFGASIVLYGHLTPGGGFAGGVILACGCILLVLSFGKEAALDIMKLRTVTVWESIGALCFLAIALAGLAQGAFFQNVIPRGTPLRLFSGGGMMWSNIAIGIKVWAGLFTAFLALALFRIDRNGKGS